MNVVSLSGRVAQDIKLIETSNDSHVITINLAVKSDYYKAGKIMDLPVLDHIIIGNKKYCSLKEKGNMG